MPYRGVFALASVLTLAACGGGDPDDSMDAGDGDGDASGGSSSGGSDSTGGDQATGGNGTSPDEFEALWTTRSTSCRESKASTTGYVAEEGFNSGRTVSETLVTTMGDTSTVSALDTQLEFDLRLEYPSDATAGEVVPVSGTIDTDLSPFDSKEREIYCFEGLMLHAVSSPMEDETGLYHRIVATSFGYPAANGSCQHGDGNELAICFEILE